MCVTYPNKAKGAKPLLRSFVLNDGLLKGVTQPISSHRPHKQGLDGLGWCWRGSGVVHRCLQVPSENFGEDDSTPDHSSPFSRGWGAFLDPLGRWDWSPMCCRHVFVSLSDCASTPGMCCILTVPVVKMVTGWENCHPFSKFTTAISCHLLPNGGNCVLVSVFIVLALTRWVQHGLFLANQSRKTAGVVLPN